MTSNLALSQRAIAAVRRHVRRLGWFAFAPRAERRLYGRLAPYVGRWDVMDGAEVRRVA